MNKIPLPNFSSFSVLMCVYKKDNPDFLDVALSSIYSSQELKPDQVVLVCDGELTPAIEVVITRREVELSGRLTLIRLPENVGLAKALNRGLLACKYDLVARMDADDVSSPCRFKEQVEFMSRNQDIGVLSSWVNEVNENLQEVISVRVLPQFHDDIAKMAVSRNPISHPVSIFRKNLVLSVGGYPAFRKSQDYALWSVMLLNGVKFANLQKVLLDMRAGQELMQRRGLRYLSYELQLISFQRRIGFINFFQFIKNIIVRSLFRCSPSFLRAFLYRLLRSN